MAVQTIREEGGVKAAALSSLLAGLASLGIIAGSAAWIFSNLLTNYLRTDWAAQERPSLPLGVIGAVAGGFLVALVGLVIGFGCLPEKDGPPRSRLCKWMSWTGLTVSLVGLAADFGLISVLQFFTPLH
jgi:hypothetical protein